MDPCNCILEQTVRRGAHVDRLLGSCGAQTTGRVLTHEVGHYLDCSTPSTKDVILGLNASGDRICDTNPQAEGSYGFDCNTYQSCGSADPDRNYMNYGNGSCFEDFTSDQIRRMRCVLESYRPELGTLVFPGACCFEDGSCELATESGCGDVGGTYQGEGSACEPNNCPQPPTLGACCLPDLSCSEVEASECATLGGDYKGDDSVCASFNCGPGPAALASMPARLRLRVNAMLPVVISGGWSACDTKIAPCRLVPAVLVGCVFQTLTHLVCPPVVSSKARVDCGRSVCVPQPLARAACRQGSCVVEPATIAGPTVASTPTTTRHTPTPALNPQRQGRVVQQTDRAASKPRPTVKVQVVRTAATALRARPTHAHSLPPLVRVVPTSARVLC